VKDNRPFPAAPESAAAALVKDTRERFFYKIEGYEADVTLGIQRLFFVV
jgi:hypothetical protein